MLCIVGLLTDCGEHIEILHVGDVGQLLIAVQTIFLSGQVQFSCGVK